MISVQNPPLPLNGSKARGHLQVVMLCGLVFFYACGTTKSVIRAKPSYDERASAKPRPSARTAPLTILNPKAVQRATLSLLLPFKLGVLGGPLSGVSLQNGIEANSLVWDFYQGFIMALDSVGRYNLSHGKKGLDVHVFDTGDDPALVNALVSAGRLDESELIVGPLYPAQIKQISGYAKLKHTFFISPVSPQPLSNYMNPYLVMLNSPLDGYALATARFIGSHYPDAKITIIESGASDKSFYEPMMPEFPYPPTLIHLGEGGMASSGLVLSQNLPNVLILPSLDKGLWSKCLLYLERFASTSEIIVFAHPNFSRLNISDTELLQTIHLHYPSTNFLDKEDPASQNVQAQYKRLYKNQGSEYSWLGYDAGLYFGQALTSSTSLENVLMNSHWKGVHNEFHFTRQPGEGYWNQSIKMLHFEGGALREEK